MNNPRGALLEYRSSVPLFVMVAGLLGMASCTSEEGRVEAQAPLTWDDVGVISTFGEAEQAGWLSLLRRPRDAVIRGENVLILDESPPWIRVFKRDGEFLEALVSGGEGPGEAVRPSSLATASGDGFVLTDRLGVSRFDPEGRLLAFTRRTAYAAMGAVEACSGRLFAVTRATLPEAAAVLGEITPGGSLDTLLVFAPSRLNGRAHHTWFSHGDAFGLLVYPEEAGRPRLLRIGCDGEILREITLDPLGPGQRAEILQSGTIEVTPAEPPFPAGLALVDGFVLWAVQERDSTTSITAYGSEEARLRVTIDGWYQLLGHGPRGDLLFGNSFSTRGTWGFIPSVVLVDGRQLLGQMRAIDQELGRAGIRTSRNP